VEEQIEEYIDEYELQRRDEIQLKDEGMRDTMRIDRAVQMNAK
jgi:hypothetical protein